jgi:hypothetical protein
MQTTIVIIILILAVGYAVWHVYKSFSHDADPCCGCEGCPLKGHNCHENHKKADCCRKK